MHAALLPFSGLGPSPKEISFISIVRKDMFCMPPPKQAAEGARGGGPPVRRQGALRDGRL